jgi:hypothetical protein
MVGFFEKRRQERAEKEAMEALVRKAAEEQRAQKDEHDSQCRKYMETVVFTPESLVDYARRIKTPLEMIELPSSGKGLLFWISYDRVHDDSNNASIEKFVIKEAHYQDFLMQARMSAIVDVQPVSDRCFYGIPVRKKNA